MTEHVMTGPVMTELLMTGSVITGSASHGGQHAGSPRRPPIGLLARAEARAVRRPPWSMQPLAAIQALQDEHRAFVPLI